MAEATGCGALVYSRAGYGQSDPAELPRPIRYMHDEAVVLDEVLQRTGVRNAILVGHSDGASIALIYAGSAKREILRGLILEAPHVFAEPSGIESIAAMKVQYESSDLRDLLARHHGENVDCAFRGWNDVWLDPGFRDWNIEEFLPAIDVPILLLQGSEDEYGSWEQIKAIEGKVRSEVKAIRIPTCGHAPHRDHPGLVLAAMTAFVLEEVLK